jgi:O-antigen/teichoic acid export membrane protein
VGLAQSTANGFGAAVALGRPAEAARVLATGFWAFSRVVGIALAVTLLVGPFVPWGLLIKGSAEVRAIAPWIIVATAVMFLVELPLSLFGACLRSIGFLHVQQGVAVAQTVSRTLAAGLHLWNGGGLLGLILLLGGINLATHAVLLAVLRRRVAGITLAPAAWDAALARDMHSSGFFFLLLQIAGAASYGAPPLVISAALGTAAVAPYAVAQRLVHIATSLTSAITAGFGPELLSAHARGRLAALQAGFRRSSVLCAGVGAMAAVVLWTQGEAFITWWVGTANFMGTPALRWLAVGVLVSAALQTPDALLIVTGRHRRYALAAVWEATLEVGLALWAVGPWGIAGVLAATVASRCAGTTPVLLAEANRLLQGALAAVLLRVVRAAAPALAVALAVALWIPDAPAGVLMIAARAAAVGAAFLVVYGLLAGPWRATAANE